MDVTVVSLSQEVSFEDASVTNILLLKLPSGRPLRAVITDASAKMLYEDLASVKTGAPHTAEEYREPATPAPVQSQDPGEYQPEVNEDGAQVFGGDVGEEDAPAPMWTPPVNPPPPQPTVIISKAWTDPEAQARAFHEKQRQDKKNMGRGGNRRGAVVQKDDMGYPIVQSKGGIDPQSVLGGGATDEDGVGQV